jgi:orotidine-5'-phosphate decarboxylase
MTVASRIIVALDFPTAAEALALARILDPSLCQIKVGHELFAAAGPALVENLTRMGFRVFLDLKFHDIPNTVAAACRAAARLDVWMLNVHALGGRNMLLAARDAIEGGATRPLLLAVTLLTSLSAADLREIGLPRGIRSNVVRLANLAQSCGLDGVVCSAQEAGLLREQIPAPFILVTPGIRLPRAEGDDQVRIVTPAQAIRLGSDYLVIGRPITRAPSPLQALQEIQREILQEGAAKSATSDTLRGR